MATLATAKTNITKLILDNNYDLPYNQMAILEKIADAINWAWENWDKSVTSTYTSLEEFAKNWIENEDFAADGYDEAELIEVFA